MQAMAEQEATGTVLRPLGIVRDLHHDHPKCIEAAGLHRDGLVFESDGENQELAESGDPADGLRQKVLHILGIFSPGGRCALLRQALELVLPQPSNQRTDLQ